MQANPYTDLAADLIGTLKLLVLVHELSARFADPETPSRVCDLICHLIASYRPPSDSWEPDVEWPTTTGLQ